MKRNYISILAVGLVSAALWSFLPKKIDGDTDKDKMLLELMAYVLEKGHYSPVEINDDFSKKAFDVYIQSLDPTKRFFLESDIVEFKKYEFKIDDLIQDKDISFFNLTYARLMKRMEESKTIYKAILEKPFNFNETESINIDYEKAPYASTKSELDLRWKKQLKLSVLSTITDKEDISSALEKSEKEVKDKKDKTPKTFAELEINARKSALSNLDNNFSIISELKRDDWFSIFLNAIVTQFDPHTYYFSPEDKDKFDVSMSGKFEGIGAKLSKKSDAVEVSELISGGPAWRGKLLEQGDLIIKVGQENEDPIDIVGMRLDDVIKKIKGPKGTLVKLTVKKIDGSIKVIPIVRDEVETEETFAKSSIVNKNGQLFGIIYLPKFYISFDNKNNRDAFKDVALEVERLKAQNVSGIILDLRDNGGGSLETVVKMTGLFIEKGPIVQVKPAGKKAEVLPDLDPKVQWNGPLVVMVNNYSASASEIFAAAIQDYNRGVVVGSKQTYGKGTVQNVFDLNNFVRTNNFGDLGALKTTTQKFYRINGGSTQLEGVKSDIVFPDRYAFMETGEKGEKSALQWDKIDAALYTPLGKDFSQIIAKSKARIANNESFKLITENAKWLNDRKDDNDINLNYAAFKKEMTDVDKQTERFKLLEKYNNSLIFQSLPYELDLMSKDNLLKEKRERWHEDMTKDIYLNEALNVLGDQTSLSAHVSVSTKKLKKAKKNKLTAVK